MSPPYLGGSAHATPTDPAFARIKQHCWGFSQWAPLPLHRAQEAQKQQHNGLDSLQHWGSPVKLSSAEPEGLLLCGTTLVPVSISAASVTLPGWPYLLPLPFPILSLPILLQLRPQILCLSVGHWWPCLAGPKIACLNATAILGMTPYSQPISISCRYPEFCRYHYVCSWALVCRALPHSHTLKKTAFHWQWGTPLKGKSITLPQGHIAYTCLWIR